MSEIKKRLRQNAEEARLREERREEEIRAVLQSSVVAQEDELWRVQSAMCKAHTWHLVAMEGEKAAEKEAPVRKFKWATSLDERPAFDPAQAAPRENIFDVGWGPGVSAVVRSGSGSLGVFFVNTDKGAVVLKGSRSIASEAFASLIAAKLNIPVPRWRIVSRSSREGEVMVARLAVIDPAQHAAIFLSSQMHVFLQCFLPGQNFAQLDHEGAEALFGPEGALSPLGTELLRQLGRIMALDVLINNGDRLPLIWENRGNAGNIIVARTSEGPRLYSIDTQVLPIATEHDGKMDQYMEKVIDLVKATRAAGPDSEAPHFARVRSKLKEFLRFDVGLPGSLAMQAGFMDVAAHTRAVSLDLFTLQHWRELLRSIDVGMVGMEGVQPDFVMAVWSAFAAHGTE